MQHVGLYLFGRTCAVGVAWVHESRWAEERIAELVDLVNQQREQVVI